MMPTCQLYRAESQQREKVLCQQFCLGQSCPVSHCLESGQFSSSPCILGAFQAASLTVELRMYESELSTYVGPSRATARNPAVSVFHSVNTHWFLELGVMRTSLPGNGTLLWGPGVGLGPLPPKDIPPDFYLVWNQPILYLSLLPVLM